MPLALSPIDTKWSFDEYRRRSEIAGAFLPPVMDGAVGPTIIQDGRVLLNFASINFLNLQARAEVRECFVAGADRYGLVTGGSRMSQGISRPHQEMERELANLCGKDAAISFASGLLANFGFVHAMTNSIKLTEDWTVRNGDSVVVMDRDAHWSLWKAAEGLPFNRRLFVFRHNDPASLESILSKMPEKKTVVVFESVYSADGSVAPIGELLDVCDRYGAVSYVDDANGFMIYGPSHRPFAAEFAEMRRADFVMVSFSKSIGLEGGAIAGPRDAILAFEALSGTAMFTAAMQPPTAYTARYLMRKLREEPELMDNYLDKVARFRRSLQAVGCSLHETPSYISSVRVNNDAVALALHDIFLRRGYLVPVFHYPVVAHGEAVLRLILNVDHSDEQIEGFVEALADLKAQYAF